MGVGVRTSRRCVSRSRSTLLKCVTSERLQFARARGGRVESSIRNLCRGHSSSRAMPRAWLTRAWRRPWHRRGAGHGAARCYRSLASPLRARRVRGFQRCSNRCRLGPRPRPRPEALGSVGTAWPSSGTAEAVPVRRSHLVGQQAQVWGCLSCHECTLGALCMLRPGLRVPGALHVMSA